MGIKDRLFAVLRRRSNTEALQIDSTIAPERSNNRSESLQSSELPLDTLNSTENYASAASKESIELQKDSLQLGIAAGYTGKSLKEIESSLNRIELQMVSKDWFTNNFVDHTPELIELIRNHDRNVMERFKSIEIASNRLKLIAGTTPEPLRSQIAQQAGLIDQHLPLSPKMSQLLDIVKQTQNISYDDLSAQLGISRSALRGLLANTIKRINSIERYASAGKRWVRYKENQKEPQMQV